MTLTESGNARRKQLLVMPMEQVTDLECSQAAGVLDISLFLKTGVFNLWNFQCI